MGGGGVFNICADEYANSIHILHTIIGKSQSNAKNKQMQGILIMFMVKNSLVSIMRSTLTYFLFSLLMYLSSIPLLLSD